jgi:ferric-dicitrate binding protein FerR (iron transport regulator)
VAQGLSLSGGELEDGTTSRGESFAADQPAAMLYSHGTALLNGDSIARSSAIFSGDLVQTNAGSAANINASGSIVLVHNDSLVQYQGNAVNLEHGTVSISTSKSMATRAGDVTVSPAASVWTEFEVRDVDGKVQIAARTGDLTISDDTGTTTLAQGQQTTRAADNQTAGEVKALIPAASRNAQPLNVKDSLEWNDLLKTDAEGRLRVGLTAGSILSLGSNSELQVVQHDAVSQQTLIVVNYGKLRNQVAKITKPDGKYEVRTPNAVIGIAGTDFYVGYSNNQTTVICYAGKVAVTPAAGAKVLKSNNAPSGSTNTVILAAGQMVVIGLDIPPGGFQPISTPAAVAEASIRDTNVPDQPLNAGKKTHKRAAAPAAGTGSILSSPWAIGIGGAAAVGGVTWVLLQSEAPVSPSK